MGLELRDLGYTWVFAPDADTTIGPKDPTIGTRAPSDNPEYAGKAAAAATRGFLAAGIIPTPKHYPGHGSVTTDSHQELPVQEMPLNELKATDLQPFSQVVEAGTPTVMLSHIAVQALAPDVPASLAPQVYTFLAQETGFNGVAVTDSLGMGAVTNAGGSPSVRGIQAGADLLLMPADTRLAHAELVGAINDGSVPRERIEEAAAKVVALQRWQQTTMDGIPVPGQAGQLARQGAKQLSAAAITQVSGQCEGPQVSDGIRIVGGSAADRAQLAGAARAAGLRVGTGTTIRLVQTGSGSGDVVVALDWPTVLAGSAGSRATYALYGQTEGAYAALVDVLTGAAPAPGGMAVEVPTVRTVDC
ncbi:MAG: beta-N-acetylhexosaminidase [Micrococcales bacterium]|nr:MAG: beta-N-acetylhexosaminidase [Micrococcales bacterium]